jgi:hypothetical protein
MSEFNVIGPAELKSPNHFDQRDRREECMLPMAPSEYKPTITLQEAILHATGVGYEARKRIDETRKNIDHSRRPNQGDQNYLGGVEIDHSR